MRGEGRIRDQTPSRWPSTDGKTAILIAHNQEGQNFRNANCNREGEGRLYEFAREQGGVVGRRELEGL